MTNLHRAFVHVAWPKGLGCATHCPRCSCGWDGRVVIMPSQAKTEAAKHAELTGHEMRA